MGMQGRSSRLITVHNIIIGKINKVSSNPEDFKDVKLWIIGGPAHVHAEILKKIAPFVQKDSFVVFTICKLIGHSIRLRRIRLDVQRRFW